MASIDQEIKSKFQNERHRFMANLMFTAGWVDGLFVDFLKPFGISPEQFNILRILRGAKDWRKMSDVKTLMIQKSPNATRLSDKLLSKELIERRRSEEDRRVVYVKITDLGLKLLLDIDDKTKETKANSFLDNFTDEEAAMLNDVLDRIRA